MSLWLSFICVTDVIFQEIDLDAALARRCLAIMALAIKKATPKKLDASLESFIKHRVLKVFTC